MFEHMAEGQLLGATSMHEVIKMLFSEGTQTLYKIDKIFPYNVVEDTIHFAYFYTRPRDAV